MCLWFASAPSSLGLGPPSESAGTRPRTVSSEAPVKRGSSDFSSSCLSTTRACSSVSRSKCAMDCSSISGVFVRPRRLRIGAASVALTRIVSIAMPPTWNMMREPTWLFSPVSRSTTMASTSPTAPRRPLQTMTTASCQLILWPHMFSTGHRQSTMIVRMTVRAMYRSTSQPRSVHRSTPVREKHLCAQRRPARRKISVFPTNSMASQTVLMVSLQTKRGQAT
mmetsp:Transcript_112048/g.361758  ORF Transcript_112048/g.361758 Transcript_112048/m.361758 type:complete len:223 (-) Transcript_112048:151-819(-)